MASDVFDGPTGMPTVLGPHHGGAPVAGWGWSFQLDGVEHLLPPRQGMFAGVSHVGGGAFDGPIARVAWQAQERPVSTEYRWSILNRTDRWTTLGHAIPLNLVLGRRFVRVFEYRTAAEAPLALVLRGEDSSLLLVTENPLVRIGIGDTHVDVRFQANLRLAPGATHEGDPFHVVVVPELAGTVVGRCLPKHGGSIPDRGGLPNPGNHVLDDAEVDALRALLRWRIPRRRRAGAMFDVDWVNALHPDVVRSPNMAETKTEANAVLADHVRIFDEMAQLGVDRVVLDEMFATDPDRGVPTADGWHLAPAAAPILAVAQQRGLHVGLYSGCGNWPAHWPAVHSSSIAFLQDEHADWKIATPDGRPVVRAVPGHPTLAPDAGTQTVNCLAHAPFREWFVDLVSATIRTHQLTWWGWDIDDAWQLDLGGCWATHHDHTPGSTTYALLRAMREVEGELRRRHPDLLIMNYWGRKQLGPFGVVDCDLNENGCEYLAWWPPGGQIAQTLGELVDWRFGWHDPDLAWRSANDLRLQYYYNAVDRFLPNHIGYGPFNGELVELIAAVAAGAMVAFYDLVPPQLHDDVRGWLAFAEDNHQLLETGRPRWGPPRAGGVDGWYHAEPGRALAFLFNPNTAPIDVEVPAPAEGRAHIVRDRHPQPGPALCLHCSDVGSPPVVRVEGSTWRVIEIIEADGAPAPPALGEVKHGAAQPFAWTPDDLAAHEATLPPMPSDLASSNLTHTSLYHSRHF